MEPVDITHARQSLNLVVRLASFDNTMYKNFRVAAVVLRIAPNQYLETTVSEGALVLL